MRVVFAGTPEFAAQALAAILADGNEVVLVLTQPDRPAGRGMSLQASPVKQLALQHGLPVHQPSSLKSEEACQPIIEARPDVMVVAAYGLILPQAALDIPRLGCLNIHASLLPRWRGAAPIQRAILAGDAKTGVTIMRMEAGLDSGPMLLKESLPIADTETAGTLHDKLAALGARLIVEALPKLERGELPGDIQPEEGVTYAAKLEKAEAALDWRRPALLLDRAVRAFNPFPGATAQMDGQIIKIWRVAAVPGTGEPGTVLAAGADGIVVACGEGALCLTELQKAGGKRLPAADFLRGFALKPGQRFALAAD
ncbi:MAG: methionyl-tRNA formyltransferase [Candidatus Desulfobacillus denitrificans]|jgi:methionyl-tRNA formyltransferase|uniref:Methionyl-tRNA formyltransferase n=1 Tax=Candidatus Desulfobacillus denitrificans TaxID=2608985 RepID=A0A809S1B2_9PROT|nr:methionyl-tRNA formyltransferase [Zoogloeaceae bacterium]MCL4724503.1 methionyl-tRNA formyltransferase [Rhodocyclaceae bacterium]MCZ2174784.1 methionyl-tRNA formyltransferase [Burkholderiales bacterium]BBO19311.1 methionyl-tRNA formyltransferase [Candidatus Desulfobacillus denitrificans]GIK46836.1 MAG: methionyl-tRNA formyltransferase [Betaproteobacteria bacterium]